jgi:hypothetical protein
MYNLVSISKIQFFCIWIKFNVVYDCVFVCAELVANKSCHNGKYVWCIIKMSKAVGYPQCSYVSYHTPMKPNNMQNDLCINCKSNKCNKQTGSEDLNHFNWQTNNKFLSIQDERKLV